MSLSGSRTYAGFGLGAIQSGLFLYEAFASHNFERLVVAEVAPETVRDVRANGGSIEINIAHRDGIEAARIGPIEILDPAVEADRRALVAAIADAHEIGTAVPGIHFYQSAGPESLCHILAAGLAAKAEAGGPRAVVYAAENHNRAAEILSELVMAALPAGQREGVSASVRFLNTVIGKMSGVVSGEEEIADLGLAPMTPGSQRAILVEAFNRILISRIDFAGAPGGATFQRGITSFVEKPDLLPFEEAKLYGHNATHALAAYLGALLGVKRIANLPSVAGMMDFLRAAFIEESGAALIHRYQGCDELFTPGGYAAYADDLLERMGNPWLADTVERVGRDARRKLAWDDRLVGTLRLALAEGVTPERYALGTAAALISIDPSYLGNQAEPADLLGELWSGARRDPAEEAAVLALVAIAMERLRRWHAAGSPDPAGLLAGS